MKRDVHELLRKIQLLLTVSLAAYPIHWIGAAWLGGGLVPFVWLYSLAFVILGSLALFVPGKLRVLYGFAASIMVFLASFLFPDAAYRKDAILQASFTAAQLLWSLQLASWDRRTELPGYWISLGIGAHLAGQILLLTEWAEMFPGWLLRFSLYGFVLLTMFSVNRRSLVSASGKRGIVSGSLERRNLLLILVLFAISLVGGLIPSAFVLVKDFLLEAIQWAGRMIARLLARVDQSGGGEYEQSDLTPPDVLGEGGRTLELPPFLQTVILYIGAAISVVFVLWILLRVFRKLLKAAREGWDLFGKFLTAASEDYVDEISDTRDSGSTEGIRVRRRVPRRYRKDPTLSPEEQVRKRYQHLKLTHPEWSPGSTAREKVPQAAAAVYERARYSGHTVSEEEAALFHENLQDL